MQELHQLKVKLEQEIKSNKAVVNKAKQEVLAVKKQKKKADAKINSLMKKLADAKSWSKGSACSSLVGQFLTTLSQPAPPSKSLATPSKSPTKTTISTPTSKAKTSAITQLKSGMKTPSSVTKPKATSVKTPSVTSSPSVVKTPTIKGGTKVTLSKPATSVAASTASESSATTLSEDISPAPVVENKKQVGVIEPTVEESPREVDPIRSVEETTEEP